MRLNYFIAGSLALCAGSLAFCIGSPAAAADIANQYRTVGGGYASAVVPLCASADGTDTAVSCPAAGATVSYAAGATTTVATGGTAVLAAPAGSIRTGFDLKNPATATEPLFFCLAGAAGTAEGGATFALPAGAAYHGGAGTAQALSVNAATSGHVFSLQVY